MSFSVGNTMITIAVWLVVLIIIAVIAIIAWLVYKGVKAHQFDISAGSEEMVGRTAEVKVALRPKGVVLLEGERWSAVMDKGQAEVGEEVTVTRVDGLLLYVSRKQ